MVATTLFAVDVVPLMAASCLLAVEPLGSNAQINKEPGQMASEPGSKAIRSAGILGHRHTFLVALNVWLKGGL